MKCPACNAEISDNARFCPYCGQNTAAAAAAAAAAAEAAAAAAAANEPVDIIGSPDTYETRVLYQPDEPRHAGPQQQFQQPQQQPQFQQPQQQPQPQFQPQTLAQQQQPQQQAPYGAYGQAPQGSSPYQGYAAPAAAAPAPAAAAPRKSKKTPIIIAVAIVAALAIGVGVCFAMGVGPFAKGGAGGGTKLDPNADPIEQLESIIEDIQGSGNFAGTFNLDMDMDLGSLGSLLGMEEMTYNMRGSYSLENYDPNDYSNLKMHMDMSMDILGEIESMSLDYADGEATVTENGSTYTESVDASELLSQAGSMSIDTEALREYVKSSRIEGDTIIIELDTAFLDSLLSGAMGSEGLEGMDASIDGLELRAKIGDGSVDESMDLSFTASYMGYDISLALDLDYTIAKK